MRQNFSTFEETKERIMGELGNVQNQQDHPDLLSFFGEVADSISHFW